jgi:hypothetical protein
MATLRNEPRTRKKYFAHYETSTRNQIPPLIKYKEHGISPFTALGTINAVSCNKAAREVVVSLAI